MSKFFFRFFLIVLAILIFVIIFLSYVGIETDKFDGLIKGKANEVNQHITIGFKKTKIHLNLTKLNLVIKLQNPKILVKKNEIILSRLDLFLSLRSFFTSDFLLKRAEVAFAKNDIKDLAKITNIFLPKIINKQVNKIFPKGNLGGKFFIPFESDGSIGKDYGFSGKVSEASINLTKELSIKKLTAEINHSRGIDGDEFKIIFKKGSIFDLELKDSIISLKRTKGKIKVKSSLRTKGNFDFSKVKKISRLFALNVDSLKDINGSANLTTNINFDLSKQFKIRNLSSSMEGEIEHLEMHAIEKEIFKNYLPEFDPKIVLKNTKIKFIHSKSNHTTELNGFIKVKEYFDNFVIKEIYDYNSKSFDISGILDLTNSKVKVTRLNFNKDSGEKSELNFDINFILGKYYNINNIIFSADKTNIRLSHLKLNKNFQIKDFKKMAIKTYENKVKNNDFLVEKLNKIEVTGDIFDAQPLLKSIYKKSDKNTFDKNFNSQINVNLKKALTGTEDDLFNFAMVASINKGSFNKLSLKGNFTEDQIVEISLYQIDKNKKTLQVISDRAKPFVKNFDFIKGFEGGKLEYESVISKEISNSNLTITDFKVSKVPALAQLLTLASLQGIADTLSGEGIRFDSFEMKSNSKANVLNIEDILAIGPAVSILMEGYIDKGSTVSLRGTLVPATRLNSIIASIPVVGEILVGKKTGEGVVGVSFKMKGPPKDIKTTVNPIKTLTPRFIVRAVEKMKKNEKDKAK